MVNRRSESSDPERLPAEVPVCEVSSDEELTVCRRLRRGAKNGAWPPFALPEFVRVWVLPSSTMAPPLAQHAATRARPDGHGRGQRLLLIDDRAPYRRITLAWYHAKQQFHCEVVATATEGLALLAMRGAGYYGMIVSDVSMEYELAGLYAARYWHRLGFDGIGVLSSTGFDNFFGLVAATLWLGGNPSVDWLIPKTSLKLGTPRYVRCRGLF